MVFDNTPSVSLENVEMCQLAEEHRPLAHKEITKRLRKRKNFDLVFLCKMHKHNNDWWCNNKGYYIPQGREALVSDLAELSLTHNVIDIYTGKNGIEVYLFESCGDTNIDIDFIEELAKEGRR